MSLRKKTIESLKQDYPELYKFSFDKIKRKFLDHLISDNSWSIVIPAIFFILFIGAYVHFGFLELFTISLETAKSIIDKRIANIASITSITLIVVGFIINNLAVKKSFAFKCLFKHSYLYPIIYFILGSIGVFVIISMLRDHISAVVFTNLVVTGVYIFVFNLVLIAFLFNSIIRFTNEEEIKSLLEQELLKEGLDSIKRKLIKTRSQYLINTYFKEYKIKEYSVFEKFNFTSKINLAKEKQTHPQKWKRITNVTFSAIENIIKNHKSENLSYTPLGIGDIFLEDKIPSLLFSKDKELTKKEKKRLRSSIKLKTTGSKKRIYTALKHFENELESSVATLNHRETESVLISIQKIYELQLKYYFENKDDEITYGLSRLIWESSRISIDKTSKELFFELHSFVYSILNRTLFSESIFTFQLYITFPSSYYSYAYDQSKLSPITRSFYEYVIESVFVRLKELIRFGISIKYQQCESIEEKKLINQFSYYAFLGFSNCLYLTLKNIDLYSFKKCIEEYEQTSNFHSNVDYKLASEIRILEMSNENGNNLKEIQERKEKYKVENQFNTYYRHVLKAIKYWIFFLYEKEKLNIDDAEKFLDLIKIKGETNDTSINDILFFRGNESHQYFQLGGWDYTERQQGVVYSPPSPHNWMTKSFFIDLIQSGKTQINIHNRTPDELKDIHHLYDRLKSIFDEIKVDFIFWQKLLNVSSLEDFEEKSKSILKGFSLLKRISSSNKEQEISQAKLNQDKINEFRERVGKAWKNQSRITHIFDKFASIEKITDTNIKLKNIGKRTFLERAKMMFIDGDYHQLIYGVDDMGATIGRWDDSEFFHQIISDSDDNISEESMIKCLNKGIALLKERDIVPDLIFMSPEYSYSDDELLSSKSFVHVDFNSRELSEYDPQSYLLGHFDSIPIYSSFSDALNNKAVICDFKTAFKMRIKENSKWFDNQLNVNVYEISEEQAEEMLKKEHQKWKFNDEGIELTDKDAITLIRTSINIDIWSTKDFQILDKNAYTLTSVNTKNTKAQQGI